MALVRTTRSVSRRLIFLPQWPLCPAPFPVKIDMNSVVGIELDLNVNASVQSDLSISKFHALSEHRAPAVLIGWLAGSNGGFDF